MSTDLVTAEVRIPGVVRDIELSEPLPGLPQSENGRSINSYWLIIRLWTEPIGMIVVPAEPEPIKPDRVGELIEDKLHREIVARVEAAGLSYAGITEIAAQDASRSPYLAERELILRSAERVTVVICTRDRPEGLHRCLEAICGQLYPSFHILVVDNAPATDAARRVVEQFRGRHNITYVCEQTPGLSWARNRAIAEIPSGVIAWVDDDEIPDPYWLSEIARALYRHPGAGCVTGVIVPAELETEPQEWFEQYGGHSKGRGFTPSVHAPESATMQSPLYPLPTFGAGGNMAFRREALVAFGGFDTALGAGTTSMGAEDTLAFTLHLLGGGTLVYHPGALVRHFHRRDLDALNRQMFGYGVGLGAFYTRLLICRPASLLGLVRLVPRAMRDRAQRGDGVRSDFPRQLFGANQRGLISGPIAYLRARHAARHLRRNRAK